MCVRHVVSQLSEWVLLLEKLLTPGKLNYLGYVDELNYYQPVFGACMVDAIEFSQMLLIFGESGCIASRNHRKVWTTFRKKYEPHD